MARWHTAAARMQALYRAREGRRTANFAAVAHQALLALNDPSSPMHEFVASSEDEEDEGHDARVW